jgi:hypothetical protein
MTLGSSSDGGDGSIASHNCVVDLSAFVNNACPASFEDVLASDPCQTADRPTLGECNTYLGFSYGHDGRTNCYYDPSTGALIGGSTCGVPPFFQGGICECTTAGASPSPCAAGTSTDLCTTDGGSAADH